MKSLTPIILILDSVGLFFWYIYPKYDEVKALQVEQQDYQAKIDKSLQLKKMRDELMKKYNAMDPNDLEKLKKILPDTVDNVRLIIDIDNIASQYGMVIRSIAINSDAKTAETGKKVIDLQDKSYGSLTLSFTTTAPYDVFLKFLTDLEESQRIVDIVSLSVTADKTEAYSYSVTLKTYWLR
jgi:hypothetical protein